MSNTSGDAVRSDARLLFGVTGALAHKKIFPVIFVMAKRGVLNVPVVGLATCRLSPAQLRKRASDAIKESGKLDDKPALDHLLSLFGDVSGDYGYWLC